MQMVWLVSVGIFLLSIALGIVFYNQFARQVRVGLRERTEGFKENDSANALLNLKSVSPEDMRITIISEQGDVVFDNMSSPEELPNHLNREEIEEALEVGIGESQRFSETLKSSSYYYAVRLSDGTILRTAKTIHSIWQTFAEILPISIAAILVFIACGYLLSNWLAKRVITPLHQVDFANTAAVPYDELLPFARTLAKHQVQIEQNNEELQAHADTINAIMNNISEGVVLLDQQGNILLINKSAVGIFDTEKKMIGHHVLELWRDVDFSANIQIAFAGQRTEMVFEKEARSYRVLISPAAEIGVIVLLLDITEKSAVEMLRREFSANVSHELKTPLTSIYGNTEMLAAGIVKEEDKTIFYSKIMGEVSRLMRLIEDIMMISKLDEGRIQTVWEKTDIAVVAKECIRALEQQAVKKQVEVMLTGSARIQANTSLLYEMFYNLIDNAIKYNDLDGKVNISIIEHETEVEIIVSDTGIGIAKSEQGRIFERFYRVDKSRSKKSGGTGLGLAIVKHIVLAHQGTIQVISELGQGTEFRITLPRS